MLVIVNDEHMPRLHECVTRVVHHFIENPVGRFSEPQMKNLQVRRAPGLDNGFGNIGPTLIIGAEDEPDKVLQGFAQESRRKGQCGIKLS